MKIFLVCLMSYMVLSGCAARRSPEYHLRLAGKYYQKGAYNKSVEECQKALLIYPFHMQAQYNLGNAYAKLERWDLAENAFQQAVWIKDSYPEPHYGLAVAYARTGRLKKALKELNIYLNFVPNDKNALKLFHQIKGDMRK